MGVPIWNPSLIAFPTFTWDYDSPIYILFLFLFSPTKNTAN